MNESQLRESPDNPAGEAPPTVTTGAEGSGSQVVIPAQSCPTCSAARAAAAPASNSWVYVIGGVDARYSSLAVEKEAIGAMARANVGGLSNDAALQRVLQAPQNAYLVREICWVLLVQEVETYILVPRYPQDYSLLVEAAKNPLSVVVGTFGPVAGPDVCNGLTVPFLIFDMIWSFDKAALMADLPLPAGAEDAQFRAAATDAFNQIVATIGSGTGMERAVAYLLVKDPRFYQVIWEAFNQNAQLTGVELKAAPVNSTQNLVDVVVRTQNRVTGVHNAVYARLALAGKFPYVVNYWQPYLGQ